MPRMILEAGLEAMSRVASGESPQNRFVARGTTCWLFLPFQDCHGSSGGVLIFEANSLET